MKRHTSAIAAGLIASLSIFAAKAPAASILFSASDASGRSASAHFNASGNILTLDITNTSTVAVSDPTFILSGVFFNIANNPTLVAKTATGNVVNVSSTSKTATGLTNIAGEWAYKSTPGNSKGNYGLSSAGFGLFGPSDLINSSSNISGPLSPDGIQLGILPSGALTHGSSNGGISGTNGQFFVDTTAHFTFQLPTSNFDPFASISHLTFQYGTAMADSSYVGAPTVDGGQGVPAPLPVSAWGGMLLLGGLGIARWRHNHAR